MPELVFIGLGLNDETDISLKGLEEIKTADTVYAEFYTNPMPNMSINRLEEMTKKKLIIVKRRDLEEENAKLILEAAKKGKTVLLTPGDPLIATTHTALRIMAEKERIRTRVVHGASIMTAAIGLSGLHNYKFGRSVTIPLPQEGYLPKTPYDIISGNMKNEQHTFCFLDVKAEEKRYMHVHEGIEALLELEKKEKKHLITEETIFVGVARAGAPNAVAKAAFLKEMLEYDFGAPPHTLLIPSSLHFMEAEALITLCGAPTEVRRRVK